MANLDLAGIITRVCTDLRSKFSKVSVTPTLTSGTKSATVTVDGTDYDLYAPASYELPTATASTLGGVKIGSDLSVTSDGIVGIAVNAITSVNLVDNAVTLDKIDEAAVRTINGVSLVATDSQTDQTLTALGFLHSTFTPAEMALDNRYADGTYRLCWIYDTSLEVAPITFVGNLRTRAITLYARGRSSMATGTLGVDTNWTITELPTDGDGVSY